MSIEKGQKMWLSKYALSRGINEQMAETGLIEGKKWKYVRVRVCGYWVLYTLGRDIHATRAEAVKAAETARIIKIASLRKQIAKLEKLTFEVEQ